MQRSGRRENGALASGTQLQRLSAKAMSLALVPLLVLLHSGVGHSGVHDMAGRSAAPSLPLRTPAPADALHPALTADVKHVTKHKSTSNTADLKPSLHDAMDLEEELDSFQCSIAGLEYRVQRSSNASTIALTHDLARNGPFQEESKKALQQLQQSLLAISSRLQQLGAQKAEAVARMDLKAAGELQELILEQQKLQGLFQHSAKAAADERQQLAVIEAGLQQKQALLLQQRALDLHRVEHRARQVAQNLLQQADVVGARATAAEKESSQLLDMASTQVHRLALMEEASALEASALSLHERLQSQLAQAWLRSGGSMTEDVALQFQVAGARSLATSSADHAHALQCSLDLALQMEAYNTAEQLQAALVQLEQVATTSGHSAKELQQLEAEHKNVLYARLTEYQHYRGAVDTAGELLEKIRTMRDGFLDGQVTTKEAVKGLDKLRSQVDKLAVAKPPPAAVQECKRTRWLHL